MPNAMSPPCVRDSDAALTLGAEIMTLLVASNRPPRVWRAALAAAMAVLPIHRASWKRRRQNTDRQPTRRR